MMNNMGGMNGQFGFGMPNQGNFNAMAFNGMNPMGGMPNMMGNGAWNMNPMGTSRTAFSLTVDQLTCCTDFNNMNMPNMPYGSFGGNMGMPGMNDMSAMNMNYGGGYGNGWQGGMNGGYDNFNGFNGGAYNQSGAQYPQMMNQFPKNNFQNQNRFPAGAAFPREQNIRRGSYGNYGSQNNGQGFQQSAHSRPGSRAGPSQNVRGFRILHTDEPVPPAHLHSSPQPTTTDESNPPQRDGEPTSGDGGGVPDAKVDAEKTEASSDPAQEGKVEGEGIEESATSAAVQGEGDVEDSKELAGPADENDAPQPSGLNPIQTVDSVDEPSTYEQQMSYDVMQGQGPYPHGMMGNLPNQGPLMNGPHMNGPYGGDMGFTHHNNYGHMGGYDAAYGAATVLTGEPQGLGVKGAPTGPRAMREGRPNTGFSSRLNSGRFNSHARAPSVTSTQAAAPVSPGRRGRGSPERDDTLREKERSISRGHSRSGAKEEQDDGKFERGRSQSADRESKHKHGDRARTPISEEEERRRERRHERSSRHDERDSRRDTRDDGYDDHHRDDRDSRGDRTREASVESRHRSRRDKDKHRSSRSHRDRSREHRRRHRSRSRSPVPAEDYDEDAANGVDVVSEMHSRHKHRSEKEKYRERERERDRSRDRDRERDSRRDRHRDHDRDYEYDKEKERSRDKDRDRKRSRRDRDGEVDERDYEDEKHRSSRRSRKDRDRDADRDPPTRAASPPPPNAPTGPSANGFSIRGRSKTNRTEPTATMPPPSGPRSFQPPKGPAADRDENRDSREGRRRRSSITETTPTSPVQSKSQDHYAAEREKHTRERVDKEKDHRDRDRVLQSVHGRATGRSNSNTSSSRPNLSSKRSRDDVDRDDRVEVIEREDKREDVEPVERSTKTSEPKVPTGPSSHSHRDKRRKSDDNAIANLFTQGLRKHAKGRRGGVKMEGDVEKELERGERERDSRRW